MEEKVLTTHVRGIYCRQCPEWIVDDLLHTRGVLDAAVLFWRAELTVRYDPQIVTEAELQIAVTPPVKKARRGRTRCATRSKAPSDAGRRGEGHTFFLTSIADSFCGGCRIK